VTWRVHVACWTVGRSRGHRQSISDGCVEGHAIGEGVAWGTIRHLTWTDRPDRGAICERGIREIERGAVTVGSRGGDGTVAGSD
jgi:hypothetical protein